MNTRKLFLVAGSVAAIVEGVIALKLFQRWSDLRHEGGLTGAYQTSGALLIGWPTVVFALAATYVAFRSAVASERQAEAAIKQAVAADLQAAASRAQLREQIRPCLIIEKQWPKLRWDHPEQAFSIRNTGPGTASNIRVWYEHQIGNAVKEFPGAVPFMDFNIPPAQTNSAPQSTGRGQGRLFSIEIAYTDTDERRYSSIFQSLGEFDEMLIRFADKWSAARERET